MAKQLVGPVERHVEKIVVGVAGLFLIGVLALFLVSSPNKIQIEGAGEPVSPSGIDAVLAQKANQVREQIRAAKGKVAAPDPLADDFALALDPFKGERLGEAFAGGVAFGPAVPIIDPPSVIEGSAKLVEVIPLPKPVVYSGRSTLLAGGDPTAVNWVTVASRFEVKKQVEAQGLAYGETRRDLVFGSVDLQRRGQRPDGSWSDDDWQDVDSWPAFEMPTVPPITLEGDGKKVGVAKEEFDVLQRFRDTLQDPGRQQAILRPLFVEVLNGNSWTLPNLASNRELMIFDDEIRSPQFESETLEDRYGLGGGAPVDADLAKEAAPANEVETLLRDAQKLLASDPTEADCVEAYNKAAAVLTSPSASTSDKTKAGKLQVEAEQKERDIKRRGGGERPDTKITKKPRTTSAQQVVWAHDAAPNSVPSGPVQYRMRMTLFNRLAGEPLLFRNKEDATQVFVPGAWSEPSAPIDIPATERFFVTACDERKQEVKIEMFRWFDGVWVEASEKFGVGGALALKKRVDVPWQGNPAQVDRPEVEFDNHASIIEIDTKRTYREQKKGTGKGGVKFGAAVGECAVVLVDQTGRLEERVVAVDKDHPDRTALKALVFKPKKP